MTLPSGVMVVGEQAQIDTFDSHICTGIYSVQFENHAGQWGVEFQTRTEEGEEVTIHYPPEGLGVLTTRYADCVAFLQGLNSAESFRCLVGPHGHGVTENVAWLFIWKFVYWTGVLGSASVVLTLIFMIANK